MRIEKEMIKHSPEIEDVFNKEIKKILFFDIETTGFLAASTSLYLIGLISFEEGHFIYTSLFAESPEEEKNLLIEFLKFTADKNLLISYNGNGFDLPYLRKKYQKYEIETDFENKTYLDYYREFSPFKHLFSIENLKQPTVEAFLGMKREDDRSGGELISYYQAFLQKKDTKPEQSGLLYQILIKHNRYDLHGLFHLTKLYSFTKNFKKYLLQQKDNSNVSIAIDEQEIRASLSFSFVPNFLCKNSHYSIAGNNKKKEITLFFPIIKDELKYFFEDYKNYYYLPKEDRAVHKELAKYMDKAYREKAKPNTAFIRKEDRFIALSEGIKKDVKIYFKKDYSDKRIFLPAEEFSKEEIFCALLPIILNEI